MGRWGRLANFKKLTVRNSQVIHILSCRPIPVFSALFANYCFSIASTVYPSYRAFLWFRLSARFTKKPPHQVGKTVGRLMSVNTHYRNSLVITHNLWSFSKKSPIVSGNAWLNGKLNLGFIKSYLLNILSCPEAIFLYGRCLSAAIFCGLWYRIIL